MATGPDNNGSLTENIIDVIEAFGAPRPSSKSLSELYQALATAIVNFAPGSGSVSSVSNADGSITISPTVGNVVVSLSAAQVALINSKSPTASPTFTGTPTAPTALPLNASTQLSTTAYTDAAVAVETSARTAADALKANIASPSFTGTPAGPTASPGTNTTQLATTAFVEAAVAGSSLLIPANVQTGPYTAQASDYLKAIEMNNPSQSSVTVPPSIFSAGQSFEVCGINLGQVRILPGSGFTLDTAGGANVLRTRWSTASMRIRGAGEGVLSGDLINLIALINEAFAFNASSGTLTATTLPVTAGNALVASVEVFTATTNTSGAITDTAGGTWTPLTTPSSDALTTQHQYFICNNPAAGVHAVTFTPTGSPGGAQLVVTEWSGGPFTFDKVSTAAFTSSTTGSTPSITPTNFNELIIASGSSDGTSSTMLTPTGGFLPLATQVVHSNNPVAYYLGQNIAPISCSWAVSPADTGTGSIIALIGT